MFPAALEPPVGQVLPGRGEEWVPHVVSKLWPRHVPKHFPEMPLDGQQAVMSDHAMEDRIFAEIEVGDTVSLSRTLTKTEKASRPCRATSTRPT